MSKRRVHVEATLAHVLGIGHRSSMLVGNPHSYPSSQKPKQRDAEKMLVDMYAKPNINDAWEICNETNSQGWRAKIARG
jgi:hypothetical protein